MHNQHQKQQQFGQHVLLEYPILNENNINTNPFIDMLIKQDHSDPSLTLSILNAQVYE